MSVACSVPLNFGNIIKATEQATDKQPERIVAIHQLNEDDPNENANNTKIFLRELELYVNIKPYIGIPTFHGFYFAPDKSIVTEFLENGSLAQLYSKLKHNQKTNLWTDTFKAKLVFGIACTMMHLHSFKAVHRRLNPDVIFFDKDYNPKVTEFSFSKIQTNNTEISDIRLRTKSFYVSPEIIDNQHVSSKTDVYSFGVILLSIAQGNEDFHINHSTNSLAYPEEPKLVSSIIKNCIKRDPAQRPTFSQIVKAIRDCQHLFPETDENEYRNFVQRYIQTVSIAPQDRQLFSCKSENEKPSKPVNDKDDEPKAEDTTVPSDDSEEGEGVEEEKYEEEKHEEENDDININDDSNDSNDDANLTSILKKANHGDTYSMVQVGRFYEKGLNGTKINKEEAFKWYKKAADEGHIIGLYNYATCLKIGLGTKVDINEAYKKMKEAAKPELNNPVAMTTYGGWLLEQDRKKNQKEALKYFEIAMKGGNIDATISAARIYASTGQKEKAKRAFLSAGELGSLSAYNDYAFLCLDDPATVSEGILVLKQNAARNSPESNYNLGMIEYEGKYNCEVNHLKAFNYFKRAAHLNQPEGCFFYAKMLANGEGDKPKNTKRAADYYQKAISFGSKRAMINYALMLQSDNVDGVQQDLEKAASLLKQAADKGSKFAMKKYAKCLSEGKGVEKNQDLAQEYIRRAGS